VFHTRRPGLVIKEGKYIAVFAALAGREKERFRKQVFLTQQSMKGRKMG
jgi:hypothetical protein